MARGKKTTISIEGQLQAEVMEAVWALGEARVEDVRQHQPADRRSAYTTIQTVMNRLVGRGLLTREKVSHAFVYRARYDEAAFLARALGERLQTASAEARTGALLNLVGELDPAELDEIARYANRIRRARRKG